LLKYNTLDFYLGPGGSFCFNSWAKAIWQKRFTVSRSNLERFMQHSWINQETQ